LWCNKSRWTAVLSSDKISSRCCYSIQVTLYTSQAIMARSNAEKWECRENEKKVDFLRLLTAPPIYSKQKVSVLLPFTQLVFHDRLAHFLQFLPTAKSFLSLQPLAEVLDADVNWLLSAPRPSVDNVDPVLRCSEPIVSSLAVKLIQVCRLVLYSYEVIASRDPQKCA